MVISGTIVPPPEIRAVVNKTAMFVAKNGKQFEGRILNSAEGKSAKFAFMQADSPFYGYYEERISFFETGGSLEAEEAAKKAAEEAEAAADKAQQEARENNTLTVKESTQDAVASVVDPVARAVLAKRGLMLADRNKKSAAAAEDGAAQPAAAADGEDQEDLIPPAIQFATVIDPIAATDMEVDAMKLSARFTACCGREFLTSLIKKENLNPLFDFLKPTNPNFAYFTALVDSYRKIVSPSEGDVARVAALSTSQGFLDAAAHMSEYKREMALRKDLENEEGTSLEAATVVDWNDFVVVETVEFTAADLAAANDDGDGGDMDMAESDDEVEELEGGDGEGDETIKVVTDYNPRIQAGGASDTSKTHMMDPITKQLVPLSQMSEHMRIQLLDPKWKEQQARASDKQKESNIAAGESIVNNLQSFAKNRGDIFGTSEEDRLQKKANDLQRSADANRMLEKYSDSKNAAPSTTAPGPTAAPTVAPTVAPAAQPAAFQPPAAQPTAPLGRGRGRGISNQPAWMQSRGGSEPEAKRARTGDAPDIGQAPSSSFPPPPPPPPSAAFVQPPPSQQQFAPAPEAAPAAPASGPISFFISCPVDQQYSMQGQTLDFTADLESTTKQLVEQLSAKINVPANKYQLKYNGAFLKPAHTLATSEVKAGSTLEVIVKTRGGKK
jgi:splicing factor 3A subunit 1